MTDSPPPISEAEREILKALWQRDCATVREIRQLSSERGRQWAHTTINTLLSRMEQKGLVARDTTGFAHVFRAAISRDAIVQRRLVDLATEYCDGESVPLMLALVESQDFTRQEIDQFRKLVDRLSRSAQHESSRRIRKSVRRKRT